MGKIARLAVSCLITCLVNIGSQVVGYRPVILMHGLITSPESMNNLTLMIETAHPGTPIHNIDAYNDGESFKPMWEQVDGVYKIIAPILEASPQGAILIGHSQGGLVLRGILESYPTHNITFITTGTPHAGQFGEAQVDKMFPFLNRERIYQLCYTTIRQTSLSVCNWWKDPRQQNKYREFNNYLYPLETETKYKSNFERLNKLVLIGGPDDMIVEPWQSSHFGFYDENMDLVECQDQKFYKEDYFGLRSLDEGGRVHIHTVPGVHHFRFHHEQSVFDCCIEPWLD